jgi:hypothetical protein
MSWITHHKRGLGIVLLALFLASFFGHGIAEWAISETWPHGQSPWWAEWIRGTFENWQSEFLQLLSMVVLTAVLIYEGSAESTDGDERLEGKVDALLRETGRISARLHYVERKVGVYEQ